ncbi:MAG: xanthine dehydrogenase accessory protein XdhC [Burkholderiales bacterium]|jgi:xanthine dehydrogenase accessory factor|nr:xanthine dehydrogenase accessory protein XdhC [Burkholderiales bacterium]
MNWLAPALAHLDAGTPAMWVVLATARGSSPRDAGAAVVVTATDFAGTLGGGTLEYRAIELARTLLARGTEGAHLRVPLGPSLGQCCGGLVTLAFKRLHAQDRRWLERLQSQQAQPAPLTLGLTLPPPRPIEAAEHGPSGTATVAGTIAIDPPTPSFTLTLRGAVLPVLLFGAGHVGRALVQALAPLPVAVTWIDERAREFPAVVPANVRVEITDAPLAEAAAAAPGSAFVVATHLHSLDEALAEAALRRGDAAWLGVIGSAAKRQRFERRLGARGLPAQALQQMQMPMGAVSSKEPEVIAASVAAELMRVRAARAARRPAASSTHDPALRSENPATDPRAPWTSSGPTSSTG